MNRQGDLEGQITCQFVDDTATACDFLFIDEKLSDPLLEYI